VQAHSLWTPPAGTLGAIVAEAEVRATAIAARTHELENIVRSLNPARSLRQSMRAETVALLTEVKRHSPSKGAIANGLNAAIQANAYAEGGASGLSILTEPRHFCGSIDDLRDVVCQVALPVLKKDFHVHPAQLLEARAEGASAALLIVRAVAPDQLADLMSCGLGLGLELLVEVRDEAELELALSLGATMVGVNNRNLETLVIDSTTAERLIPRIPADVIAIAESGVSSQADVERYAVVGADAVLVGSSLSAAADPVAATRALAGVRRSDRAR
jgi:indole-3-glycerol phosphate synthase